jgi:Family of unknown function (DUF6011)
MAQIDDLMAEIARVAPTKRHRLGPDMVNGTRQLTVPSAQMVLTHLYKCSSLRLEPADARMPRPATAEPGVAYVTSPAGSGTARMRQVPESAASRPVLLGLAAWKEIPAGFYATPRPDGAIDYWKVIAPEGRDKAKWEGWKFVRRVLGGVGPEDGLRTVKIPNIQQRIAFAAIADHGLDKAQELFADTMERCMDCGSPLTDPDSRAARKGPTCRKK